ncbi:MAG: hypothetical protein K1W39_12460 [Lachnospiraceae bacterium]
MVLSDKGLKELEKTADKHKNVTLLFLIDIYKMLKDVTNKLEQKNYSCNCSCNRADCSQDCNNKD